ncbi:MAG TPA: SCP2 sterol-binding domain-containing protein [Bacillus sp. (in: firmicutes)]|uniref:SCP2 sterol-binding domain-containing protein n=1 Tax=Bacillus litorisediminis TaxID=2922713 RepID=UPI001FAD61AD|nr:SCP2 sterol-binding domain-containing protein [Bacillus litorisediminis]HWO77142.1 SCP2 sterol-binding domain-containing protein [Bacillus sp. (in: firmicutes)]
MKEKVLSWLDRLEDRTDLHLLIPPYQTFVSIEWDEEKISFVLAKDQCKKIESEIEPDVALRGNPQSIQKLLAGTEMLQNLYKQKEISIKGKYRTVLLLESLCWLNKS